MTQFSDATLLSWLATKPDKLERHLDKHPEDIDRLDRLTALEERQVAAMGQTVVPPDELAERVISRMTVDPRLREAGSVFADMLSLGFRTLQVVFGSSDEVEPPTADTATRPPATPDEQHHTDDEEGRDR
jgi:hypothetical protein